MKIRFLFGTVITFLGIMAFSSCYNKNKEELYPTTSCDTTNVTYSGVINKIITDNCATTGCHASGGTAPDLSNYSGTQSIAISGSLITSITRTVNTMPKGNNPLDACSIAKISSWVNHQCPQ
jgi:hypothetical protein